MKVETLKANSKKGFFVLAGINREIIPNHVSKLAESIKLIGVIRPVVICTTDLIDGSVKDYMLDGQHLYNALMKLDMDIPYVTIKVKTMTDIVVAIAKLNSSSKSWGMLDYLTAWGSLKSDYKKLTSLTNIYDIEIGLTASLLMGRTWHSDTNKAIKSGDFFIQEEERTIKILKALTDVLKIVPFQNRFDNKSFCRAFIDYFIYMGRDYNHERVVYHFNKNKTALMLAVGDKQKMSEMFNPLRTK